MSDVRRAATVDLIQIRLAIACIVLALAAGCVASLHYMPTVSMWLNRHGLTMPKLRPLHDTFASVWIFAAGIAVVYHYLRRTGGGLSRWDVRRFWFHTACWIAAGVGIVATLLAGVFSGREYLGFHPALSVLLLLGWLAFAYTFLRRLRAGFWARPLYVWFWTVGVVFFVYTFVEGHAYLLPWVQQSPVRDLQIQWKSCGTLVGSFNFLVYGTLLYVSERLSGDESYAQSPLAFWLFGVGCLNSFTNYAHHTYHVPQSHLVKWIAFGVSMLEIVLLWRLLVDVRKMVRNRSAAAAGAPAAAGYLSSAKLWTTVMLFVSILISVPVLNSVIHGTHVVTGHAMGTMLGIDSMVLFGAVAFMLAEHHRGDSAALARLGGPGARRNLLLLNASMAMLVAWLTVSGTVNGWYRLHAEPSPEWARWVWLVFPAGGGLLAVALLVLVGRWLPLLVARPSLPAADRPRPVGVADQRGRLTQG